MIDEIYYDGPKDIGRWMVRPWSPNGYLTEIPATFNPEGLETNLNPEIIYECDATVTKDDENERIAIVTTIGDVIAPE